jgi:hypothetical protein
MIHTIYGGTYKRETPTQVRVSYWYVPGGCDYSRATVVVAYFEPEAAKYFTDKYHDPPEMAFVEENK